MQMNATDYRVTVLLGADPQVRRLGNPLIPKNFF